jgi:hypothetical protein
MSFERSLETEPRPEGNIKRKEKPKLQGIVFFEKPAAISYRKPCPYFNRDRVFDKGRQHLFFVRQNSLKIKHF